MMFHFSSEKKSNWRKMFNQSFPASMAAELAASNRGSFFTHGIAYLAG